jgi:hypothetical protein
MFSSWSDGGAISHSVVAPSTATTYTAAFNTQYRLTTHVSPVGDGTVSPSSPAFYNAGTVVPLTATPNPGATFSQWMGNVTNSTSASTTITMSAPESVTAEFIEPVVQLNTTSVNFGTVYLSSNKALSVTLSNTGHGPLTIDNISITPGNGTNPNAFDFTSSCSSTLNAGHSCTIRVSFAALSIGDLSATLNIADNAAGSPQQVGLAATVINPRGTFNPANLAFGSVHESTTKTVSTTLTNTGTTALDITNITVTDQTNYSVNPSCPGSLNPGDSCAIAVSFTPTTTGALRAYLEVSDNTRVGTQEVLLTGTGTN